MRKEDKFLRKNYDIDNMHGPNGFVVYHKKGTLIAHRENDPAVIFFDENGNWSQKMWYKNNLRHNEKGPASLDKNGKKEYWINGELHREDGPAVMMPNGACMYWLNNKHYTKEQWEYEISLSENDKNIRDLIE